MLDTVLFIADQYIQAITQVDVNKKIMKIHSHN